MLELNNTESTLRPLSTKETIDQLISSPPFYVKLARNLTAFYGGIGLATTTGTVQEGRDIIAYVQDAVPQLPDHPLKAGAYLGCAGLYAASIFLTRVAAPVILLDTLYHKAINKWWPEPPELLRAPPYFKNAWYTRTPGAVQRATWWRAVERNTVAELDEIGKREFHCFNGAVVRGISGDAEKSLVEITRFVQTCQEQLLQDYVESKLCSIENAEDQERWINNGRALRERYEHGMKQLFLKHRFPVNGQLDIEHEGRSWTISQKERPIVWMMYALSGYAFVESYRRGGRAHHTTLPGEVYDVNFPKSRKKIDLKEVKGVPVITPGLAPIPTH